MTPRLRKFALTAHVTSSVGWLGAVVAYPALAITGLTSPDAQRVQAVYLAMELIGWYVIVPLRLAGRYRLAAPDTQAHDEASTVPSEGRGIFTQATILC
jgi:hypothetical protein